MAKRALIFGTGGHARVIAAILHGKYHRVDFIGSDEQPGELTDTIFFQEIEENRKNDIFIGIGNNEIRKRVYETLLRFDVHPTQCISEHAFVAHDAELGPGIVICPGAVVMTRAKIGANVIVNTLSSIDHDCLVGNHTQVTAGVTFGGRTIVGENCFFGIKSATIPNISIGDNVVVMAGSLVADNIPSNVMVGGYPARVIRKSG